MVKCISFLSWTRKIVKLTFHLYVVSSYDVSVLHMNDVIIEESLRKAAWLIINMNCRNQTYDRAEISPILLKRKQSQRLACNQKHNLWEVSGETTSFQGVLYTNCSKKNFLAYVISLVGRSLYFIVLYNFDITINI